MKLGLENDKNAKRLAPSSALTNVSQYVLDRYISERDATLSVINLINCCGKTPAIDKYLKASVEDFKDLPLEKISAEKMIDVLTSNVKRLDAKIDVSQEGLLNNIKEKLVWFFKKDETVNKQIKENIEKIKNMPPEKIENTKISYNLVSVETLRASMKMMTESFKLIIPQIKTFSKAFKWFNGQTKEQDEAAISKMLNTVLAYESKQNELITKIDDTLIKGRVKGKTYKEAGYTKDVILSILTSYSKYVGGRKGALETVAGGIGHVYNKQAMSDAAISDALSDAASNMTGVDVQINYKGKHKHSYEELLRAIRVVDHVLDTYKEMDYLVFRLSKLN